MHRQQGPLRTGVHFPYRRFELARVGLHCSVGRWWKKYRLVVEVEPSLPSSNRGRRRRRHRKITKNNWWNVSLFFPHIVLPGLYFCLISITHLCCVGFLSATNLTIGKRVEMNKITKKFKTKDWEKQLSRKVSRQNSKSVSWTRLTWLTSDTS